MKRAEQMAWAALAGLIAIFAILLIGAILYRYTAFWVGAMLAAAQAVAVGLAAWGLALARQGAELRELSGGPAPSAPTAAPQATGGFRMSLGDDVARSRTDTPASNEAQTLDTGFQRLLVAITSIVFIILAAISAFMLYDTWKWVKANPDKTLPVAGSLPRGAEEIKAIVFDEKALLIGLSAAVLYGILYWITRPKRGSEEYSEATSSTFTLGMPAMVALGAAAVLSYFKVAYASEIAGGVICFFLTLQGFELLVNACRSYSSIEELDQEAVDLHALPLVPMLSSVWLIGLRMLFAASVGLSGKAKHERGVIARMMPRALLAIAVIAVAMSCVRVVDPGFIGVRERLGHAPTDANGKLLPEALLEPGLHFMLPWPMDQIVMIPTQQMQSTSVGTELHANEAWKGIDFQFWQVRAGTGTENDIEDLFVTGEKGAPQILETFVQVQWSVDDPAAFYSTISHSEFFEKGDHGTKESTMYEALVQQCTSFAVTRAFAIHSLEQVMVTNRREVERHCKEILQQKLDALGAGLGLGLKSCGIKVDYLVIRDLHPPYWHADRPNDPTAPQIGGNPIFTDTGIRIERDPNGTSQVGRGPASAFEFVISMREFRERLIALAKADVAVRVSQAQGFAASEKNRAETYRSDKIARAHGDLDRILSVTATKNKNDPAERAKLRQMLAQMKQRLFYEAIREGLDPVTKIVVDPSVKDLQIWQNTEKGPVPVQGP